MRCDTVKNYYEILKVINFADIEVIKASYKALCKKYHPDANKNVDPNIIIEINNAYDILKDEQKKKIYDAELKQYLNYQKDKEKNHYTNNVKKTFGEKQETPREEKTNLYQYFIRIPLAILILLFLGLVASNLILLFVADDGSWSYILYPIAALVTWLYICKNSGNKGFGDRINRNSSYFILFTNSVL